VLFAFGLPLALVALGCSETFDAGSNHPHGKLPLVDERNPILLVNDSESENWQGEYAMLLANGGGPKLVGIVVGTSPNAPDVQSNITDWRTLVAAARASGLRGIPDPAESVGDLLKRPASGAIRETSPNHSGGANAILAAAASYSLPYRPLVVVTGGRLTDVADAYLIDPTVAERVVVVSSLGRLTDSGATMGNPNGEMDPWADVIVATGFPGYIQVSAFYDQTGDVPASRLSELPADNPFAEWIVAKQSKIWSLPAAADQVAVAAVGIPGFASDVRRVSAVVQADGGAATTGPDLAHDPNGRSWLVHQVAGPQAAKRFWDLLLDPKTFKP
jgi:hypothetical protein